MESGGGGGGEESMDSHIKMTEELVRNFFKNALKGTRILFDRRGLNIFLPLRGTNF